MSLNKITSSSDFLQKQYLNIGCNDIKCTSLSVSGKPVVPTTDHSDSASFNTIMTANNATIGSYSAYYRYNDNVMTLIINCAFTITVVSGLITLVIPLPPNYNVKVNMESFPAVGFMSNNVSTPFTSQGCFTNKTNNTISCDYRQNGANMLVGQVGTFTFTGSFLVDPS